VQVYDLHVGLFLLQILILYFVFKAFKRWRILSGLKNIKINIMQF
jgi:hypothetical protein